jgi:hypothetical protein
MIEVSRSLNDTIYMALGKFTWRKPSSTNPVGNEMLSSTWACQSTPEVSSTTAAPASNSTLPTTVKPAWVVLSKGIALREAAKYRSTSNRISLLPLRRYGAISSVS